MRRVGLLRYRKRAINSDRFPFRVGEVRLAYPGTLNGIPTDHDPRPEFAGFEWAEEDS